jgi:hypothetical protein
VVVGVYVWTHVDLGSLCGPSLMITPCINDSDRDSDSDSDTVTVICSDRLILLYTYLRVEGRGKERGLEPPSSWSWRI